MIGKLKDIFRSRGGEWIVSFSTTEDIRELFDSLADKDVSIDLKPARKHRSLEANAYAWVLIDKISEKTGIRKSEVYRNTIREIGGVSTTVCVQDKAADRLREGWESKGLGWQTESSPSKIPGCVVVTLYYGSSTYDSKQMSDLINILIQDAEALGIPTISDKEAEKMLGNWERKRAKDGTEH